MYLAEGHPKEKRLSTQMDQENVAQENIAIDSSYVRCRRPAKREAVGGVDVAPRRMRAEEPGKVIPQLPSTPQQVGAHNSDAPAGWDSQIGPGVTCLLMGAKSFAFSLPGNCSICGGKLASDGSTGSRHSCS
mmetsp:Transcript_58988/g.113750  ORF Transcript_58988/g.113750 Transcript_58988/m.113750 type:complete len:132 (+) Transcript_58988:106-501(+)